MPKVALNKRTLALVLAALWATDSNPSASEVCHESSISSPGPFMGNDGETVLLSDGSLWEVKHEHDGLYEFYSIVVICPAGGHLLIDGRTLNVEAIDPGVSIPAGPAGLKSAPVIESKIDGDFHGWEGDSIFELMNGQIWKQVSYTYAHSYKFMPKVLIFLKSAKYEMQAEGMSSRIVVRRLK